MGSSFAIVHLGEEAAREHARLFGLVACCFVNLTMSVQGIVVRSGSSDSAYISSPEFVPLPMGASVERSNVNTTRQYIGFDVGGWLTRTSHDAIARLTVSEHTRSWDIASRDAKGRRIRNILHPQNIENVISLLFNAIVGIPTTVAIDAALGWPMDFRTLAGGSVPRTLPDIGGKSIDNPVLYRETERFVADNCSTVPLTAVGDMFGNPSTKAQATALLLRKRLSGCMPPFDAWSVEKFCASLVTIFETYPAAAMKSASFKTLLKGEIAAINKQMRTIKQRSLTPDDKDAVSCALVAEDLHHAVCFGSANPSRTYILPDGSNPWDERSHVQVIPRVDTSRNDRSIDVERVAREGWIFVPIEGRGSKKRR